MSRRKRRPTFMEVVIARVGVRDSVRVLTFVQLWLGHEAAAGHPIDLDYLVAKRVFSRATGFRHQALFRKAFEPFGYRTPADFIAATKTKPADAARLASIELADVAI